MESQGLREGNAGGRAGSWWRTWRPWFVRRLCMQGDSLSPRGGKFGMQTRRRAATTVEAVDELPLTLGVLETARYLGIARTTADALIAAGELPVPVLRVGRSYRVPTAPL